jgi:MazG family protein
VTTGGTSGGQRADPPRVVLVETSDALPGLLPFQAWDALGTASVVLLRDANAHPAAQHLYFAGLDLETVAPAALGRGDLDLNRPGDPVDRRIARALLQRAVAEGVVVYLLGPDDGRLPPVLGGIAPDHDAEIELVFLAQEPEGTALLRLVQVMRRLRDPEHGCPWDLEQDHASLTSHLVEEAYELIDAIERDHDVDLQEELGDVLLQVVFHAQVARDRGAFAIDDVARGIADKLVRRHPHVFADDTVADADEVRANWERIKAEEKARTGPFEGVPVAMPGLLLLETLGRKAAKHGFEDGDVDDPAGRARRGLDQLATSAPRAGGEVADPELAVGEVLRAVVALARRHGVDPEAAARRSGSRFREEVEAVLRLVDERGVDPDELDREAWARLLARARASG